MASAMPTARAASGTDDGGQGASDGDASAGSDRAPAAGASAAPQPGDPALTMTLAPLAGPTPPVQAAVVDAQTVPRLAAEIIQNVKAKASRFELALNPAGLGRVDISIRIGADGALSASLNFNSPQAADALKAHASELRDALQQAGFNLSGSDLSFTAGGQGQQPDKGQGQPSATPTYAAAAASNEPQNQSAPAIQATSSPADGLDIRI